MSNRKLWVSILAGFLAAMMVFGIIASILPAYASGANEKSSEEIKEELDALKAEQENYRAQIADLQKQLEEAKAEAEAANDKYMRMMAEYDNFRKRSAKEKEGVYSDAYCDALLQILPVLDNLERAAQFSGDDADTPMAKGLELTLKSFIETMNKMGVYEIEALGKDFDPNLHNAVLHDEDDSERENEITDVFQKGYKKGNKIIRFAMVKTVN